MEEHTVATGAPIQNASPWHWPTARTTFLLTWFVMLVLLSLPFSDASQYKQLLKEKESCEASLPRNEECRIVVIPSSTNHSIKH